MFDQDVTRRIMEAVLDVMDDKGVNPFRFQREKAHILTGEEEALFAWLTINYLEGLFQNDRYGMSPGVVFAKDYFIFREFSVSATCQFRLRQVL